MYIRPGVFIKRMGSLDIRNLEKPISCQLHDGSWFFVHCSWLEDCSSDSSLCRNDNEILRFAQNDDAPHN
jgi:hypothetical protein